MTLCSVINRNVLQYFEYQPKYLCTLYTEFVHSLASEPNRGDLFRGNHILQTYIISSKPCFIKTTAYITSCKVSCRLPYYKLH